MPYIGNQPLTAAFVTDQFNGNGSTTVFTMSVAPASTSSMLVVVSGIIQDPGTYAINGLTLTFSQAPPSGVGNVSVRYLGIPASGIVNTAYRTVTEMTATPSQTTFNVPSYTAGYINVYRNGVRLAPSDFTATSGVTVVLVNAATSGDSIVTESFYVSSVLNAIPNTAGSVTALNLAPGAARSNFGAGAVLQVVQGTDTSQATVSAASTDVDFFSTSITPTSATSKILVLLTIYASYNANGGLYLKRSSTKIGGAGGSVGSYNDPGNFWNADEFTPNEYGVFCIDFKYLDSPATTSATTYTYGFRAGTGAPQFAYNRQWNNTSSMNRSSITLMEIAA